MVRRLVRMGLAVGLLAAPALAAAVAPAAVATPGDLTVHVPRAFSPNGDGRKDEAKVAYDLPAEGTVKVVVMQGIPGRTIAVAKVGHQERGSHVWRWNGRGKGGRTLDEGTYFVNVTLTTADGTIVKPHYRPRTRIDTTVRASLEPRTDYSLPRGKALPVYPRTTVVRDSVNLRPMFGEKMRWARMVIRDAHGRAVLKKDVSDATDVGYTYPDYGRPHPDDVVWTARRGGKALPPGRYRAYIRGRDTVGNTKRSDVYPLWVSREALEWHEETQVVQASTTGTSVCDFLSTGNACGEGPRDCGQVVPSALLAGGLSHRSAECAPEPAGISEASSLHYLPVPETAGVRGVGAAKVAFSGRPTVDGEVDQGTLSVWQENVSLPRATATGSTGAETPWVDCPRMCLGTEARDETFDPGVVWSFATHGTDSVDVGTFTVTLRYLAVAG